jgi:hypothetical protein
MTFLAAFEASAASAATFLLVKIWAVRFSVSFFTAVETGLTTAASTTRRIGALYLAMTLLTAVEAAIATWTVARGD